MSHKTPRTPQHAREAFSAHCRRAPASPPLAGLPMSAAPPFTGCRSSDDDFTRAWDEAIEGGTDRLEDEAFRRAHDGVAEPVISGGRQVVDAEGAPLVVRRYSDNLLVTLLKARRPERFKDRVSADFNASVKVGLDPDADFAVIVALLDGLASRKARGEPTPELDAPPT